MERKRVQVERMLREEREAAAAPNETRQRVLREEMARARQVGGDGRGIKEFLSCFIRARVIIIVNMYII